MLVAKDLNITFVKTAKVSSIFLKKENCKVTLTKYSQGSIE